MGTVKSEAITLAMAPSVLGTKPTAGWSIAQPNPGGLVDWQQSVITVARDPLTKWAAMSGGDVVGIDCAPSVQHDLTKDWIDLHAPLIFRQPGKHSGGKGQSTYRPTGVAATGYTVAANGDLANGILVYASGFTNAANNGLKTLAGTSTTTEIKATGLVVEASTTSGLVEVAGVVGGAGDIELNGAGNLVSTVLDFTTLGLYVGQEIKLGGATTATQFATAAYNGRAIIASIAANLITFSWRSWTPGSADNGATKTIQVFFSRWFSNLAMTDAAYAEPVLSGELELPNAGSGGASEFIYCDDLNVNTFTINAPLRDKLSTDVAYVGTGATAPLPVADRRTGPSAARPPLGVRMFDAHNSLREVVLTDSTGTLLGSVISWSLTFANNVQAMHVQATTEAAGVEMGKFMPTVSMEAYLESGEALRALRDHRAIEFRAFMANGDGGYSFRLASARLTDTTASYNANEKVKLSATVPGFIDPTTNLVQSLSVYAYYPV